MSSLRLAAVLLLLVSLPLPGWGQAPKDVDRLVAVMLSETPLIDDLRSLTDEIGGRPTGSEANRKAVAWALARFGAAGIDARAEAFQMPKLWLEEGASAIVRGPRTGFRPRVAAMPYSAPTPEGGLTAPLRDGGFGTPADFARLGEAAAGSWVLIETDVLETIPDLFAEYNAAWAIEGRAIAAQVAGLIYVGSRPRNVLYRHSASRGLDNRHPMLIMERDAGLRALRLLRRGDPLTLRAELTLVTGGPYESHNVIGEIRGSERPEEVVVIGAHLDSWGLGTGALDNGCNVALVIDLARQMKRLGIQPRRTVRFALFNGEEQGLHGSWGYTRTHAASLDGHIMASSYDIGSGRITGFFTGGRPPLRDAMDRVLEPVAGLGPFQHHDVPIVGTDNYDFMMQGVGNLVANQESANYGPNYHARSDTFDKVDQAQLRLNAAIAAAVTLGFADLEVDWRRQSRAELEKLIEETDLGDQMRTFGVWDAWTRGERGRAD